MKGALERAELKRLRARLTEATLQLLQGLIADPLQGGALQAHLLAHEAHADRLWREGLTLSFRMLCALTLTALPPKEQLDERGEVCLSPLDTRQSAQNRRSSAPSASASALVSASASRSPTRSRVSLVRSLCLSCAS